MTPQVMIVIRKDDFEKKQLMPSCFTSQLRPCLINDRHT